MMVTPSRTTVCPGTVSSQLPPPAAARSTITEPGFMRFTMSVVSSRGAFVPPIFFRRLLIALDRGDLAKLPFSDDVTSDSRLLMRRNILQRVEALAGSFLTFDPDPYVVIGKDGRIYWMLDAYTTSSSYPYSRHSVIGRSRINYMRNSVKAVIDAYDGTTTFYVFDAEDPIIAAYRGVFPDPVPRRVGDAGRPAQARAVSRDAARAAGGGLRPVPHDQSGRVLQPRGSVDRRLAGRPERPAPADRAGDGAELRADDAARRTAVPSSSRSCRSRPPTGTT